jgi:predicted lysophospholipase L1 biosynthesis ABC-type transport system permease subunit
VVGVAADAKYYTLGDDPVSQVYVPPDQDFDPALTTFVLRTSVPPLDIAPAMEAAILNVDDAVALAGTRSLEDLVDGQTASYRAMAVLAGMFGAIALLLAAIGLYSVLAYLVSQSSREIGIRMALGAQSREVASSVLRRGSVLAVAGTAIGLGLAWLLAGLVREMLFGVEPQDPVTLSAAVVILMGVALLASYLPARRASRVDPAITLREA